MTDAIVQDLTSDDDECEHSAMFEVTLCVWVENCSVMGKPTVWSAGKRVVVLSWLKMEAAGSS